MKYLPVNSTKSHGFEHMIAPETTVDDVINELNLPRDIIHIVLLNGVYLDPQAREYTVLSEGDVLGFWPPIAGG